jgi:hypothetical protein
MLAEWDAGKDRGSASLLENFASGYVEVLREAA